MDPDVFSQRVKDAIDGFDPNDFLDPEIQELQERIQQINLSETVADEMHAFDIDPDTGVEAVPSYKLEREMSGLGIRG